MYFIIFSRYRNPEGGITSAVHTRTISKSEALSKFKLEINNVFNITANPGNLYCAGFNSDLPFIETIAEIEVEESTGKLPKKKEKEIVDTILSNVNLANYFFTLTFGGYKPKQVIYYQCENCDCSSDTVRKNAYGEYLCADCWASYLVSEKGLVEYYIDIANGVQSKQSFLSGQNTTEDLSLIAESWTTYKADLPISEAEWEAIKKRYEDRP